MQTYNLPEHYLSEAGDQVSYKGVGPFNPHESKKSYKSYYQWVPYLLFLQGLMFYIPHYLFKIWEGGKIEGILSGLDQVILDKADRLKREKGLAEYLYQSRNTHNVWALKLLFVDFLNFLNVVFSILLLDSFLGGVFTTYGRDVFSFTQDNPENRIDPMATIFPTMTKCVVYMFGSTGTLQNYDATCTLPMNILNEKLFVFLWVWFIFMCLVSSMGLVFSLIMNLTPYVIKTILKTSTYKRNRLIALEEIGKYFQMGDWKVLHLLSQNMDPLTFEELLSNLMIISSSDITGSNQI